MPRIGGGRRGGGRIGRRTWTGRTRRQTKLQRAFRVKARNKKTTRKRRMSRSRRGRGGKGNRSTSMDILAQGDAVVQKMKFRQLDPRPSKASIRAFPISNSIVTRMNTFTMSSGRVNNFSLSQGFLSDWTAGINNDPMIGSALQPIFLDKAWSTHDLTNNSNATLSIVAYRCSTKVDNNTNPEGAYAASLAHDYNIVNTAGSTTIAGDWWLKPEDMPSFNKFYKIHEKRQYTVGAGGFIKLKLFRNMRNERYTKDQLIDLNGFDCIDKLWNGWMFVVRGAKVATNSAAAPTILAFSSGRLTCISTVHYKWRCGIELQVPQIINFTTAANNATNVPGTEFIDNIETDTAITVAST